MGRAPSAGTSVTRRDPSVVPGPAAELPALVDAGAEEGGPGLAGGSDLMPS